MALLKMRVYSKASSSVINKIQAGTSKVIISKLLFKKKKRISKREKKKNNRKEERRVYSEYSTLLFVEQEMIKGKRQKLRSRQRVFTNF